MFSCSLLAQVRVGVESLWPALPFERVIPMKRVAVLGAVLLLAVLSGCVPPLSPLVVSITPSSIHPPCEVKISVEAPGPGTYTYELIAVTKV